MMKTTKNLGFTLLEVLISILIITIAFFAVLSTQVTAIQGYSSARDYTRAAEVAKVATEVLHIEASTWTADDGQLAPNNPWGATAGTDHPFDNGLIQIANNGWATWTVLTSAPVDERLGRGTNVLGARFCILARGDYMEMDTEDLNISAAGAFAASPVFQVQIAVVYPGPTADPIGSCGNNAELNPNLLVPDDPSTLETLEVSGLRVSFFGTVILRKDWR